MLTNEQIQFGIKSLETSITSKKEEIAFLKDCILNDLQSPNLDEYTIETIESRINKIKRIMNEIEISTGKIRVINEILNN